jgi:hypothetical protein
MAIKTPDEAFDLAAGKECRRAASQVNLFHLPVPVEHGRHQGDLTQQFSRYSAPFDESRVMMRVHAQ